MFMEELKMMQEEKEDKNVCEACSNCKDTEECTFRRNDSIKDIKEMIETPVIFNNKYFFPNQLIASPLSYSVESNMNIYDMVRDISKDRMIEISRVSYLMKQNASDTITNTILTMCIDICSTIIIKAFEICSIESNRNMADPMLSKLFHNFSENEKEEFRKSVAGDINMVLLGYKGMELTINPSSEDFKVMQAKIYSLAQAISQRCMIFITKNLSDTVQSTVFSEYTGDIFRRLEVKTNPKDIGFDAYYHYKQYAYIRLCQIFVNILNEDYAPGIFEFVLKFLSDITGTFCYCIKKDGYHMSECEDPYI